LAKHSKHFSLEDSLVIGVDRMQRNFGPLKQQVEEWRAMQLSTAAARLLIYLAFIAEETGFPKHLARRVHELHFQPIHDEFQPRSMWSPSNAFTSAFKELEPIPQYKATAKLARFLQVVSLRNPQTKLWEYGRDAAPPVRDYWMMMRRGRTLVKKCAQRRVHHAAVVSSADFPRPGFVGPRLRYQPDSR